MDSDSYSKRILDMSEEELIELGFLGKDAPPKVEEMVKNILRYPEDLGSMTCFTIACVKESAESARSSSPIITEGESLYPQLLRDPAAHTPVHPHLISKFERTYWYHGISPDPPELMWRSDFETNPFPIPEPDTPFSDLPSKTAHGVFGTQLNAVWSTVAPKIMTSMQARGLKPLSLSTTRFFTKWPDGRETKGPVVIWITVHLNTTNAMAVRDATPDILKILADAQVTDAVVEWTEAVIQRL